MPDIEKLHKKYGPVLRVAPNHVTFAKAEAWSDIFTIRPGHREFRRDLLWWAKAPGQPDSIVSVPTAQQHARMRKVLNPAFTERALKSQESVVQKYVGLLTERLRERIMASEDHANGKSAVVDIVPWFNFTTFDVFGDLGYGEPFDCLQNSRYHPWIELIFNSVKAAVIIVGTRFYPPINFLLMKCIPKSLLEKQKRHYSQVADKVQRRLNWEVERPDIMSYVINHNNEHGILMEDKSSSSEQGMTLGEVESNFIDLTTAGSETTATALSGTFNYLISNPDKLAILVEEVRNNFATEDDMTFDALSNLPYLNAVLNEGLRLCPPVPSMVPRVVPKGGDTVCGMWLPGGVSKPSIQSHVTPSNPSSTNRQKSRSKPGPSSATPPASTSPYPSFPSAGSPRPHSKPPHSLTTSDTPCRSSAWDPRRALARIWLGQRCG